MTGSANYLKRFEVYWVNLDPTIGSEIKKIRPCIIVSPDEMNKVLKTIIVVPLTSTIINWPFRAKVKHESKTSSAAFDLIRSVSKERVQNKIGVLSSAEQDLVLSILQATFSD